MLTLNFEAVPNWSFSANDQLAVQKLNQIRKESISQLPPGHNTYEVCLMFDQIRQTPLYKSLKTLPKGVIHHVHFDCCEDAEFYQKHVISDPIVYLGENLDCFHVGTQEQAQAGKWVTMEKARTKFENNEAFVKHVSNLTMLNKEQIKQNFTIDQAECWRRFQKKIVNFFPIIGAVHLFKKYVVHILKKYIHNGYDRLQFRSLLTRLTEYDEKGNVVKQYDEKKFTQTFDEAFKIVKEQHPQLSAGFIFFALKYLKPQENAKILTTVLQQKWEKTVGIDFVQEEDPNGSQGPYDEIANGVLAKFSDQNIKKVYHVGETRDHLNNNVELAVRAGSVRVGHGINIIHHTHLLGLIKQKNVCFEKSPISNIILSYVKDPRRGTAQMLLGLGIPVTINPDDPGKFGLEDTTMDYFVTFINSNWDLRHLKLIGIHSINHAVCSQEIRKQTLQSFNQRWNSWVTQFLN